MNRYLTPVLRPVSAIVATAIATQTVAAGEAVMFDCNRLNNSIAEIFTGISEPQPVLAVAAPLKDGTVILADQRALTYKKYRIANDAIASPKADKNPTLFREYMVAAEIRFCTPEKRKDLVRKYKGRYRLHCLIDEDGDESYEAIVPTGQIVRFNRLTGKNVGKPYPQPAPTLLALPINLVEDASIIVPDADIQPHVNIKYMVGNDDGGSANVMIHSAISMLPKEDEFFDWADEEIISLPFMADEIQTVGNAKLQIKQSDEKRAVGVTDYTPAPVSLQCDGTIITLPGSFTLLYPDGQAVLKY